MLKRIVALCDFASTPLGSSAEPVLGWFFDSGIDLAFFWLAKSCRMAKMAKTVGLAG